MNRWFEITVKAEIDNIENGKKKKVTEKYLVDALSYTEAESRSLEIFKDLYNSFEVVKINPIKVSEIFFNGEAEYWYKCKVNYITLDKEGNLQRDEEDTVTFGEEELKESLSGFVLEV